MISIGKVKEAYLKEALLEYSKRVSKYTKLSYVSLKPSKSTPDMSPKEIAQVKKEEGSKILAQIKPRAYVIALDIKGKQLSSEKLASKIRSLQVQGKSQITFIIGGSYGLSPEVLKRADFRLSFSKMTFPHKLMKVILIEQVYRSFKIINNEPYHK